MLDDTVHDLHRKFNGTIVQIRYPFESIINPKYKTTKIIHGVVSDIISGNSICEYDDVILNHNIIKNDETLQLCKFNKRVIIDPDKNYLVICCFKKHLTIVPEEWIVYYPRYLGYKIIHHDEDHLIYTQRRTDIDGFKFKVGLHPLCINISKSSNSPIFSTTSSGFIRGMYNRSYTKPQNIGKSPIEVLSPNLAIRNYERSEIIILYYRGKYAFKMNTPTSMYLSPEFMAFKEEITEHGIKLDDSPIFKDIEYYHLRNVLIDGHAFI